jgi:hypothetical protein
MNPSFESGARLISYVRVPVDFSIIYLTRGNVRATWHACIASLEILELVRKIGVTQLTGCSPSLLIGFVLREAQRN